MPTSHIDMSPPARGKISAVIDIPHRKGIPDDHIYEVTFQEAAGKPPKKAIVDGPIAKEWSAHANIIETRRVLVKGLDVDDKGVAHVTDIELERRPG